MRQWLLVFVLCWCVGVVTAQEEIIGPLEYPPNVNPLTGLEVDNPALLQRRPLIVKIVNAPAEVRPLQQGLMQADIVWEHLLGGGITRFSAIYLSHDAERVGPVRSVRLVDFELLRLYRAVVVGTGVAQGTLDIMRGDELVFWRVLVGEGPCPAFCRDTTLNEKLEYTMFSDLAAMRERLVERERDMTYEPLYGMAFQDELPSGGVPLSDVTVVYTNTDVQWQWNAEAGRWFRWQEGEAHLDNATGEQLSAVNVLILEDDHTIQPFVSENYWGPGNFAFYVNFIGSGRAVLLRDGHYIEGEWRRETQDGVLTFYDTAGKVLPFKAGNTFVHLMPRWLGAYNLVFGLTEPATATINTASVNLRWGPTTDYRVAGAGFAGDTFPAIGRNNGGSWVQLRQEDNVVWVASQFVTLDRPIRELPVVRPTNED